MSRPSAGSRLPNSPIANSPISSPNQAPRPAPLTEACVEHKFGGAVMGTQRADVQTEVRDIPWDAHDHFHDPKTNVTFMRLSSSPELQASLADVLSETYTKHAEVCTHFPGVRV